MNNPFDGISTAILANILAQAVLSQAARECPEIVDSRSNNEPRFLAFASASTKIVDRLGHVDTEENLQEFRVAIDKEVKVMVDAGLAAFRAFPVFFQVVAPGQHVH